MELVMEGLVMLGMGGTHTLDLHVGEGKINL